MRLRCAILVFCGVTFLAGLCPATEGSANPSKTATVANAGEMERQADVLRQQKDYQGALSLYDRALKITPKNAILWNKAGIASLQLRQLDMASRAFSQALKYDKTYAEAANNLGVVYYLKHNYSRAISNYKKAISLGETASFHTNLGAVYFDSGAVEDALREYMAALRLDPEVLDRSANGGVSAHVASPEDRAKYSFLLAKLYAKLGDVEHSLGQLKRAVENGYPEISVVYSADEFAVVRQDPRFETVMATPVVTP